jgi:TolB-like protein/Tfp pilus assembly protein PilF
VRELRVDLERLVSPMSLVPPRPKPRSRAWIWAVAAVALAAVAAVAIALVLGGERATESDPVEEPIRIDSIAVLPLRNLSGDPEQEYFAVGMTEALITDLAKIGALKVISRSSTLRFKDSEEPIPAIAELLRVDAVIQGSVLRSGDRVRITARLIHAETERHLWAESYERALRDVLAIQSEVAREIADQIHHTLTPEERSRLAGERPVDPEAHTAYLKGRYHWDKRTREDLELGLRYFREAIDKDPTFAAAHAGLADSYNMLAESEYGETPDSDASRLARTAAEKALELDEQLAEGHAALGFALMKAGDDPAALKALERAIELNPSYAIARHYYSVILCVAGRLDRAIEEVNRAREMDPLSPSINVNLGRLLYWARRYDDSVAQLRKTAEMNPQSVNAHFWLGYAYLQQAKHDEALAAHQKVADRFPSALAYTSAVLGEAEPARRFLKKAAERTDPGPAYVLSIIHTGLGERDKALEWLERSVEQKESGGALYAQFDPVFDPLRDDPRFQELLRRLTPPE